MVDCGPDWITIWGAEAGIVISGVVNKIFLERSNGGGING